MTRIDFYILQDQTIDACLRFACRLSLKAWRNQHTVHIHAANEGQADLLDRMMWDYPKHEFIPHQTLPAEDAAKTPIHIGLQQPVHKEGLLINLSPEVPKFFGRFDRVAEVIVEATRSQGREHYKHYRDRGYPLHHHQLDEWERQA